MIVPSQYSSTTDSGSITSESDISPSEFDSSKSYPTPEKGQGPPSYDDATDGRRSVPAPSPSVDTRPRVNYICIKERNSSVRGEWSIDPRIKVPASLLAELDKGEERVNLRLHSQNGSVSGVVRLVSDQPTKSFLHASSQNGSVTMKVLPRGNNSFKLQMGSQNGRLLVQIPSDFEGPVTFTFGHGSFTFSEAVERRLAHYNRADRRGKAFIGSWETSGYADIGDDEEAWNGDELELSAQNGSVRVEFAEEPTVVRVDSESGGGPFSFMRRFMGSS
ncbi:hypothetical protein FRB93_007734 [Tulasnella sp. JGI-2019a]|nr:hypothetical protein FRB93_007734 [Tulasnella sp. JGI-2019a]